MRKQLDPRIPILINNNVKKNHRSFIVLVGDKGRDQVCCFNGSISQLLTQLYFSDCQSALSFVSSASVSKAICPLVLQKRSWIHQVRSSDRHFRVSCCILMRYLVSHRKKREAKIKREVKRGIREANEQNPFEIFVTVTDIRYTYAWIASRVHHHSSFARFPDIIRNPTRFLGTRMECAYCRTSRQSRRIYSQERLKLLKVEG